MKLLALDTNLIALFCLGRADRKSIGTHNRIRSYSSKDFDLLCETLSSFDRLVMTPYAYAEVSNILNISAKRLSGSRLISEFQLYTLMSDEIEVVTRNIVTQPAFQIFGLADAAWISCLDRKTVFLSSDAALVRYMADRDFAAQWFPASRRSAH
jgi:hypothetical protein